VRILQAGSGYTTATITITGGGGTGAELRAIIQGRTGKLRSYYFDDLNIKTILNNEVGSIEYDRGIVTLVDFDALSINDPEKFLRINAKPRSLNFKSDKQSLITLDEYDLTAINVTLRTSE
jgi:hypothetical protein